MQEQYENLMQVLDHVGFSAEETQNMEQLLVTILHIGNIEFNEADDSYVELADASSIELGTLDMVGAYGRAVRLPPSPA